MSPEFEHRGEVARDCRIAGLRLAKRDHGVSERSRVLRSSEDQRRDEFLPVRAGTFVVGELNKPVETLVQRTGEPDRCRALVARRELRLGTEHDIAFAHGADYDRPRLDTGLLQDSDMRGIDGAGTRADRRSG